LLNFAIVLPNLNQSRFLTTALESLRHQSVPFHLAVMDAGSTDGFDEAIHSYADIITYLRSEPDKGQASAIQEGMGVVSGDIVAWLNADDYYFPGTLDRVAEHFANNPDVDVVYGDAVHVTADGLFISYFPAIQKFREKDLWHSCFICQPACFVRRSAYEEAGKINTALRYTMDWDLWCRLSQSGAKFKYVHELLACVRYYPGTKTLSCDSRRYSEIWRIGRKYGRSILPLSLLGFFRFDLSMKQHKTPSQKIGLWAFDSLRGLKRKLFFRQYAEKESIKPIHGFHRWEPTVNPSCIIHIPWYNDRKWKRLNLVVDPGKSAYRVTINDGVPQILMPKGDRLLVDVPVLKGPSRKISIESMTGQEWKLLEFSCELQDPSNA